MTQKVVVREETVRRWVKGAMQEASTLPKEGPPVTPHRKQVIEADDEETLQKRSQRRMDDYDPRAPGITYPSTTRSDAGGQATELSKIAQHHTDPKMKIGKGSVTTMDEPGYEGAEGEEWTEEDLPFIKGQKGAEPLGGTSGVMLDIKKGTEKGRLAYEVPEFVLQMFIKAAQDFKMHLEDPLKILKAGARAYASELKRLNDLKARDVGADGSDISQDDLLDDDDILELGSDEGLAALVGSEGFKHFFIDWLNGSLEPGAGPHDVGAPPNIRKVMRKEFRLDFVFDFDRLPVYFKAALNLMKKLGLTSMSQDGPSAGDIARDLHFDTKWEPEVTKVERYLILSDPWFRYYVNGAGGGKGSTVHYWDWVRRNARRIGKYPKGANWALKADMF